MSGRTTWWAHDAGWHRRERQVMLGMEFGAVGPNVLAVLHSWAQEQQHTGEVKGGYAALAREAFADNAGQVRTVVDFAARIGAIHDLEPSADGLLFTARISGWESEQGRAKAAAKKAAQRAKDKTAAEGQTGTNTPDVPKSPPTRPDQTKQEREGDARDRVPIDPEQPLAALDAIAATGNDKWRGAWQMGDSGEVLRLLLLETPDVQLHVVERLRDEAPRWKGVGIRSSVQSWLIPTAQQAVRAANQRETAARRDARSQGGESRRDELKRIAAGGAVVEGRVAS